MKFKSGVVVPFPDKIKEEYMVNKQGIIANISVDNMYNILKDFIETLPEPCFFLLEVPLNRKKEKKLRKSENDPFHKEVYYVDGLTQEQLIYLLDTYGNLLINDGMSCFGFASHNEKIEIYCTKYNVVQIFCFDTYKYGKLLEKYGIHETDNITTAWDTFSEEHYGESRIIEIDKLNVYKLVKKLKKWKIYFAEIREE